MQVLSEARPIRKILIAHRGEIARRILKTCQKLCIESVAVYSDVDRNQPYVREADHAFYLGASEPTESYLNINKIISVAKEVHACAIHPGFGFLAENPLFAKACIDANIIWIGPQPTVLEQVGDKWIAKNLARQAGLHVLPAFDLPAGLSAEKLIQHLGEKNSGICQFLKESGFPVLLKARVGGGGAAMQPIHSTSDFETAFSRLSGVHVLKPPALYLEKMLMDCLHVEVQIVADQRGNVIHCFDRQCSLQRRRQKLIEESPVHLSHSLREVMWNQAIHLGRFVNYSNIGTVEFLFHRLENKFYFLEMNPRLQVEHAVTEQLLQIDLIELQISIAQNKVLPFKQDQLVPQGHVIEVRLNTENPQKNFLPQAGRIDHMSLFSNDRIRVESAFDSCGDVSVHYDSTFAKLISQGANRDQAISQLRFALARSCILGVETNLDFLSALLLSPEFVEQNYNNRFVETDFLPRFLKMNLYDPIEPFLVACFLGHYVNRSPYPWRSIPCGWRLNGGLTQRFQIQSSTGIHDLDYQILGPVHTSGPHFSIQICEKSFKVELLNVLELKNLPFHNHQKIKPVDHFLTQMVFEMNGSCLQAIVSRSVSRRASSSVCVLGRGTLALKWIDDKAGSVDTLSTESKHTKQSVQAFMPGKIIKVFVAEGQRVNIGASLFILESMKMQQTLVAPVSGTIKDLCVKEGDFVDLKTTLVGIVPPHFLQEEL